MSFVQRPHGWHKYDTARLAPLALAPGAHLGNLFDNLHNLRGILRNEVVQ
jgi:hypothetical protein